MRLFRLAVSKDGEVLSLEEDTEGGDHEEILEGPFDKRFHSPENTYRAVYLCAVDEIGAFNRWRERFDELEEHVWARKWR